VAELGHGRGVHGTEVAAADDGEFQRIPTNRSFTR
jgi:hypothetical protein